MVKETRLTLWECCRMTDHDRKNVARTRAAMLVWGASLIGGLLALRKGWIPEGVAQWGVAALPLVTGLWALLTYSRFVRETDELQRKILLDALAIAFGGTFFLVVGWSVLEQVGAPVLDAGAMPLVMALLYMVGIFAGWRRYR